MEGMCRPLACSDAHTEDTAEDAGRADGGCSARQSPGVGWVWGRVTAVRLADSGSAVHRHAHHTYSALACG